MVDIKINIKMKKLGRKNFLKYGVFFIKIIINKVQKR